MKKFYFDVTQLVHWQGKLTGIPRVMHELAIRYHQNNAEVLFVAWVKDAEAFYEIDFDETVIKRNGVVYAKSTNVNVPISNKDNSTPKTGQLAKKVVKVGLIQTARVSPRIANRLSLTIRGIVMAGFTPIEFELDDRLFIPWGEWWDPNFIKKVSGWHINDGLRIIQIIHDMGPVVIPQFSGAGGAGGSTETFPAYCRAILPISSLVLCVSRNSKRDAEDWLKANKLAIPPMDVFRLGDDFYVAEPTRPHEEAFLKSGLKGEDYILSVGTIEARKNHTLLYYVYKLAKTKGIKLPKLVIAGRRGWGTEQIYALITTDPEVKEDIVFLHDASDEDLSWLYDRCLFTVFPSFYEGWGIPIAESIARGVPCVCSNTTSMTEIAEDYVIHFSPFSTDECLGAMQMLLNEKELKKYRMKAKKYKQTTWDESYDQLRDVIKEALNV